ncbi:GNAT family N-acetyltransferase [Aquipuribacter nitratireducens]|uniref:GNAT family N-acetyltransferase n=1 Tax=Aquipuribacter nitratireducens TaxID=650104 RepID=A0ABW0GUI4_9MICO
MTYTRLWPVELEHGRLRLRPLRRRDRAAWEEVQLRNRDWLQPWEATAPDGSVPPSYAGMVAGLRRQAREGRALPFAIEVDGRLRGQLTVSMLAWGAFRSGSVGYWIDRQVAGRGHVPCAVGLAADHCFAGGVHRLEINIRPENAPSLAVVRKLGLRDEGLRRGLLHIDGDWRDHVSFAVLADEVPEGLHARAHAAREVPREASRDDLGNGGSATRL